jgi:hypothetical protein
MTFVGTATVTVADGGLGARAQADLPLAVMGCSSSGTAATPSLVQTPADAIAQYGHGPLVEAICTILRYGAGPVVGCRAATTTAGSESAVAAVGTGTAVLSVTTSGARDAYGIKILITKAGASLAAATAAMQLSIDGGLTYGEETAVPTGGVFTVGNTGVGVTFADGTFVVNDTYSITCAAPVANSANLSAALTALLGSTIDHEGVFVVGPVTGTIYTALTALVAAAEANGVYRWLLCEPRVQSVGGGESVATFTAAIIADFADDSSPHGAVCAGEALQLSAGIGGTHRRNVGRLYAARLASIAASGRTQRLAESPMRVRSGAVAGIDAAALYHDMRTLTSLTSGRFCGLQSIVGRTGYYCTVRSTAATGSDLTDIARLRVIKAAQRALLGILTAQIGDTVPLLSTGRIQPATAAALDAQLGAAFSREMEGMISSSSVAVDRTNDIATTSTLLASFRAVPLGYTVAITATVGFQIGGV